MSGLRHLLIGGLVAGALVGATAEGGSVRIDSTGGVFVVPVTSMAELRWDTVVRQAYDYSCGAAAVATLLTYHYDRRTPEETVFGAMFDVGDREAIRAHGFSMWDMKQYLDAQGLRADGFRVSLDKLAAIGVPGIAMIETDGYKHFVVIKGIDRDKVLVGDPARGLTVYPLEEFQSLWNGAVVAARAEVRTARRHFNDDRDWRVLPRAPLGDGVKRDGPGDFLFLLPGRNEFGG
ncbi:MAG: C39 family peptidase [Dongiaceae bacterium]